MGDTPADQRARRVLSGTISRRAFIGEATRLGLSLPLISALLAACGATPTTAPRGSTAPATGGGSPAPSTSAAASATASGGAKASSAGKPGGSLTFGINLEMDSLDPAVTPYAVSHTVMMNVFDPLVWRGNDGKFYAGLAEKWDASADGTAFTFTLRQGVKFHDGTPWNAEALKFNLDHVADPATKS